MSADEPAPSPQSSFPSAWILLLQAVALLLLLAIRFAEPVGDGDLFWQMAYGKYVIEQRTLMPDHTIYSWTPADNSFLYCSWLAEVALYLLHCLGGLPLLFAFRYLIVALSVGLMLDMARRIGWHRRAETWCFLVWYTLASYVGSILKPELFSMLFMALSAWLLFAFRLAVRREQPYRAYLVGLVVTMVLWANSHGVFFFGLIALGVYTVGEMLNWWLSPDFSLPKPARKPFLLAMIGCLAGAFFTPYHVRLMAQLVQEVLGVVLSRQSSGDKAAYDSLAAHLSIWKATAFHFHEYLVMGLLVVLAVAAWSWLSGRRGGRIDWSYLALNGFLALLYTVYLRTTFYWPAFFVCSTLYQLEVLQTREFRGRADLESLTDFFFVGSHLLAIRFYYGSLDQLSAFLKFTPEQSVRLLAALGFLFQSLVLVLYIWVRLAPRGEEADEQSGLSALEPRSWLTTLALVATLFLSGRACYESIFFPYSSSWCGFGVTYWNPVDEVEFIQKYHPNLDRIINDYDSGGYLIWKLFPKTKVMIDPRSFPYRKFWADYIRYERGQIGMEFLDRFTQERPEVSLVSLKNDKLWRSFLNDPEHWAPAWCGKAYVVFVKRGFTYPPDAIDFMPDRFETLRNAQKAMQIYRFGIEANAFDLSWKVLEVMQRKFNTTPEEKRLVQNLEAYKECLLALEAKDFKRATQAQETCYRLGMFVNANLLLELYKQELIAMNNAGKKTTDPEMAAVLEKAQRLIDGKDPTATP